MASITFDPEEVQQVVTASEVTISTLAQAISAVEDHLSVIQSALQGTNTQIPARLENWQSDLKSINTALTDAQSLLKTLYQQMQALIDLANS